MSDDESSAAPLPVQAEPSESPFKHIALSLSGGGVRAVGFHLGMLDYLKHTNLLHEVHTLSSVSGGSLVAIGYALSLKKGETFQEFHDNICEFLPELNTLEELLKSLEKKSPPVASGSRTMITALAKVYRDNYFDRYYQDPKFGIFWDEEPEIHLKDVIFNATEFKSGIAFRFQKGQFASLIGNGKIALGEEFAKEIRMSDIMAASSCIPGGMEPLRFPQDFHWPDDEWKKYGKSRRPFCDSVEDYLNDRYGVKSVPLMDGGVYDNQGITSIILTLARSHRGSLEIEGDDNQDELTGQEPVRPHTWARWLLSSMEKASDVENQKDMGKVDLFIVSDTPSRRDPMYSADPLSDKWKSGFRGWLRRLTLGKVSNWGWALTIIFSISVFFGSHRFLNDLANNSFTLLPEGFERIAYGIYTGVTLLVPAILVLIAVLGLIGIRILANRVATSVDQNLPLMERSLWFYTKKLRMGQLWDMITLRAGSMTALTSRIFMNRIRQLGYTLLYSHPEYRTRVIDNDINTLIVKRSGKIPPFVSSPSEAVTRVVTRAAEMGTKLWIAKPERERNDLDVLIASGQISTCFNIIKYIWRTHTDEKDELNENVRELFETAKADWLQLNENPYHFVDKRKHEGRKPGSPFWQNATRKSWRRWYSKAGNKKTA